MPISRSRHLQASKNVCVPNRIKPALPCGNHILSHRRKRYNNDGHIKITCQTELQFFPDKAIMLIRNSKEVDAGYKIAYFKKYKSLQPKLQGLFLKRKNYWILKIIFLLSFAQRA